jgi:hypothetical protein
LTNIGGVFGLSKLPSKILMPILNCLFSSTYPFVFSIAVERYVAISRPLWHKIHATRHFCSTCVIILWLICFAYTGICSALRNANLELTYYNAVQSCFLLLFFFGSVASYFLAFLSMRRQRQTLENVTSELTRQTAQVRLKNQSNFLKIIFIVNIFLIFGLLPTVCFFVLVSISHHNIYSPTGDSFGWKFLYSIFDVFFLVNIAINPFLYFVCLKRYRKTFLILYWKIRA